MHYPDIDLHTFCEMYEEARTMDKPQVEEIRYLGFFETLDYVIEKYDMRESAEPYVTTDGSISLKARVIWYLQHNQLLGKRNTAFPIPYADLYLDKVEGVTSLPAAMKVLVNYLILEFDLIGENKDVLFKMDW